MCVICHWRSTVTWRPLHRAAEGSGGLAEGGRGDPTPQGEGSMTEGRDWSGGAAGRGEAAEAKGGFFRGPPGSSALLSSFASRPSSVWHPRGGSRSKRLDWGALHPESVRARDARRAEPDVGPTGTSRRAASRRPTSRPAWVGRDPGSKELEVK